MPKPLNQKSPTSSVAAMLDPTVASRITAPARLTSPGRVVATTSEGAPYSPQGSGIAQEAAATLGLSKVLPLSSQLARTHATSESSLPSPHAVSAPNPITKPSENGGTAMVARQFSLTPKADRTVRLVIDAIARGTGLELNQSELLRAMLLVMEHSLEHVPGAAAELGALKRPRNKREKQDRQSALEEAIASAVREAILRSTSMGTYPG